MIVFRQCQHSDARVNTIVEDMRLLVMAWTPFAGIRADLCRWGYTDAEIEAGVLEYQQQYNCILK